MYINTQQSGVALLALLFTSVLAVAPPNDDPWPDKFVFWDSTSLEGKWYSNAEIAGRENKGDCHEMLGDIAQSARAPKGYKCTIYSDTGCHGWRTREFTHDGIYDMGKMNKDGEAWRCCKIGTTNYWGYCDAKLNRGT